MRMTTPIPSVIRVLAEDQSADYAPWPGSHIVHRPGFDVWFGPPYYPDTTVVRHVRLTDDTVEDGVRSARDVIRTRGRTRAEWSIGSSATPNDLATRLVSMGMTPDAEVLNALVLRQAPDTGTCDVVVRRATSREDFRVFYRIQQAAFETDPDVVAQGEPFVDELFESTMAADHVATYLAILDGEPVATARATFTDVGVLLNGGSTLHRARGQGAYRALVAARWQDAVERGTPVLTTLARPTSYPILKRLGFEDVCEVRMFRDTF
jgi:Fe2+ transport system protein FeoA